MIELMNWSNLWTDRAVEELIEQLVSHDDMTAKLSELTKRFDESSDKYESLHSELKITQNCNSLLPKRLCRLERNAVSNSQYHRRETLEINPAPSAIQENVLEKTVCQALFLTGINVSPDELHSCHRLNKKYRVIVKFKCRKHRQNVLYNRRNLESKRLELTQLKFSGKLLVSESLSYGNQQLAYKCQKLKSGRKICSTWFYNNCVNIKLSERSNPVKIFHVRDIENLVGADNLEELLRNS